MLPVSEGTIKERKKKGKSSNEKIKDSKFFMCFIPYLRNIPFTKGSGKGKAQDYIPPTPRCNLPTGAARDISLFLILSLFQITEW